MKERFTRNEMTLDQRECLDLLCVVFGGEHHVPEPRPWGDGIRVNVYASQLATFDYSYLTRLVVLAHDMCIRAQIDQGGPRTVGVCLTKRHTREGSIVVRHPTMEEAIETIRAARTKGGA